MQEYIEFIVKQLVKHPEDIVVEEEIEGRVVRIKVCANPEDMGVIIGKEGKTIRNIRSMAKAKAIKDGVKVYVDVC